MATTRDQHGSSAAIRTPTRHIRSPCCAPAASGQATALPSSVMKWRRFNRSKCMPCPPAPHCTISNWLELVSGWDDQNGQRFGGGQLRRSLTPVSAGDVLRCGITKRIETQIRQYLAQAHPMTMQGRMRGGAVLRKASLRLGIGMGIFGSGTGGLIRR